MTAPSRPAEIVGRSNAMTATRKPKVLIAKAGLDGHDVGAKIVARALLDAGFDVTYTGLRQSPEQILGRAHALNVDVVGLSLLSGSHLPFCRKLGALRQEAGPGNVLWIVGGVIPQADQEALRRIGVDGVFPVGTPLESIADFIWKHVS
ncbi:MAG: cobalamin B12-binding domain-containing protein [Phycisphaerae bacterium]